MTRALAALAFGVMGLGLQACAMDTGPEIDRASTAVFSTRPPGASLLWLKKDQDFHLLGGATFEACRIADEHGVTLAVPECTVVTDDEGDDFSPVAGEFELVGLDFGTWSVEEIEAPEGFVIDPTIVVLDVVDTDGTDAIPNNGPDVAVWKEHIFINFPAGRADFVHPFDGCNSFLTDKYPELEVTVKPGFGLLEPGDINYWTEIQPRGDADIQVMTMTDPPSAVDLLATGVKVYIVRHGRCRRVSNRHIRVSLDPMIMPGDDNVDGGDVPDDDDNGDDVPTTFEVAPCLLANLFVPQTVTQLSDDNTLLFSVSYDTPPYLGTPTAFINTTTVNGIETAEDTTITILP